VGVAVKVFKIRSRRSRSSPHRMA